MNKSICFALLFLSLSLPACAQDLDLAASKITVHVEKSGLFSAFAHNHTIAAPLASGHLDVEKRTIKLQFHSKEMKVLDPGTSDSERSTIESTMKSSEVLDPARFPEITFVSTSVETSAGGAQTGNKATANPTGATDPPQRYSVRGHLALHGVNRPVELAVSFSEGHYTGRVTLKQTDYGITPVKIAGGTIRVKDVIGIVFDIAPAK